jgi:hypothetical protein
MAALSTLAIPTLPGIPAAPPLPVDPRGRARPARRARPSPRALGPLLPAEPALYPWLARRFAPGEATLWVGPARYVETLLELLYAGCAAADGRVSLLEGANRFQPYRVGERARALALDPGEALERVRLARAFTAYQMIGLVDAWAREIRRTRPTLLVAHEIPALFYEAEFPPEERGPLLGHAARVLADLVRTTGLPLLVTCADGLPGFPGLAEHGPRLFDLVRVAPRPGGVHLDAYREAAHLALLQRPDGQRGLEEFGLDSVGEVSRWDGRSRRTAKRSRSG